MKTLDAIEAAKFLKISRRTLFQLLSRGALKRCKIGRSLVFLTSDLEDFIRSQQTITSASAAGRKDDVCQSTNAALPGGAILQNQMASALDKALAQRTKRARKNCTTS